jgi:hypothetical protein
MTIGQYLMKATRGSVTRAALGLFAATTVTVGFASNSSAGPPSGASHSPVTTPAGTAPTGLIERWITLIGLFLPALPAGNLIIETLFNYPGLRRRAPVPGDPANRPGHHDRRSTRAAP